jgi:hypothetical protein
MGGRAERVGLLRQDRDVAERAPRGELRRRRGGRLRPRRQRGDKGEAAGDAEAGKQADSFGMIRQSTMRGLKEFQGTRHAFLRRRIRNRPA